MTPDVAPPTAPEAVGQSTTWKTGMAVAGLVCSVVALFFSIIPFIGMLLTPTPAILGMLFGAIGLSQANKGGGHKLLAIAGVACGVLALVIVVALAFATNGWT